MVPYGFFEKWRVKEREKVSIVFGSNDVVFVEKEKSIEGLVLFNKGANLWGIFQPNQL